MPSIIPITHLSYPPPTFLVFSSKLKLWNSVANMTSSLGKFQYFQSWTSSPKTLPIPPSTAFLLSWHQIHWSYYLSQNFYLKSFLLLTTKTQYVGKSSQLYLQSISRMWPHITVSTTTTNFGSNHHCLSLGLVKYPTAFTASSLTPL